jgi:antitoxin MazE
MKTRIKKWGNSLALRIPRAFAKEVGIDRDVAVDISVEEGRLVVIPSPQKMPTLDELLKAVTEENKHREVDTGLPVGEEIW